MRRVLDYVEADNEVILNFATSIFVKMKQVRLSHVNVTSNTYPCLPLKHNKHVI